MMVGTDVIIMEVSIKRKEVIETQRKRAARSFHSGYSLREVAKMEGMSHEWVRLAVKTYPQDINSSGT